MDMNIKKNSGFSLVELVIVIVVLGLLAVAALPRFLNVTDEARIASIEGVAGGYATAVLSARAQWEAHVRPNIGGSASNSNYVDYDGDYFWLTSSKASSAATFRDGYPIQFIGETEPTSGTAPTTLTEADCINLMQYLMQNPPTVSGAGADTTYIAEVLSPDVGCKYTQNSGPAGAGQHFFEYNAQKGSVTVTIN